MMKRLALKALTHRMPTQRYVQRALLYKVPQRTFISDYFVQPMLQERQEKSFSATDTKELF